MPAIPILRRRRAGGLTAAEAADATEAAEVALEELANVLEVLVQLGAGFARAGERAVLSPCRPRRRDRDAGRRRAKWTRARDCRGRALCAVAARPAQAGAAEAVDDGGAEACRVEFHVQVRGQVGRAERCGRRVAQR